MKSIDMKKYKKKMICGMTALAVMGSTYGAAYAGNYSVAKTEQTPVYQYDAMQDTATATYVTPAIEVAELEESDFLSDFTSELSVEEKDVNKDETVYAFANPDGSIDHVLVSETLNNIDKADVLTDKTNLKDIVNVKGDETFTQNGDEIVWEANGNDITYQGTTDAKLPVDVKVSYYLDGNQIAPNALAGKSGKVTIRFDYKNQTTVTRKIDGKDTQMYVPFVAVSGLMLGSNFQNITVTNGKVVSEGQSNIVLGYAMPGMKENLQADGEESIFTDYFEMTADVTDFSLDMTVTFLTTASAINIAGDMDLSKVDELVETIEAAGGQLSDGSTQLSDGLNTLNDKMGDFKNGVSQLKSGLEALSAGSASLAGGVSTINASAQAINGGIAALNAGVSTPMDDQTKGQVSAQAAAAAESAVTAQFDGGMKDQIAAQASAQFAATMKDENTKAAVKAGLIEAGAKDKIVQSVLYSMYGQACADGFPGTFQDYVAVVPADTMATINANADAMIDEMVAGVMQGIATTGASSMGENVAATCETVAKTAASTAASQAAVSGAEGAKAQIAAQINAVQPNGYSLVTGAQALAEGTNTLEASVPTLAGGVSQLLAGANELSSGTAQLGEGVGQLAEGSDQLKDGINQFNHEAIDKLADAYNGDVKTFVERLHAVLDASMEYETFTMLKDGDVGTTKFIIKTEGIYE